MVEKKKRVTDNDLIKLFEKHDSVLEISKESGLSVETIQRRYAVISHATQEHYGIPDLYVKSNVVEFTGMGIVIPARLVPPIYKQRISKKVGKKVEIEEFGDKFEFGFDEKKGIIKLTAIK